MASEATGWCCWCEHPVDDVGVVVGERIGKYDRAHDGLRDGICQRCMWVVSGHVAGAAICEMLRGRR
jgi:hypothetical protein